MPCSLLSPKAGSREHLAANAREQPEGQPMDTTCSTARPAALSAKAGYTFPEFIYNSISSRLVFARGSRAAGEPILLDEQA